MIESLSEYRRVAEDDPMRCQFVNTQGQCRMIRINETYCKTHAANGNKSELRNAVRNFRLTQFQARVEEFADNDKVKSLREEIGILRMMLEEIINKCQNATELIISSGRIGDLVMKVEKLVTSCHRLEAATGMLIDKTAAIHLGDVIINIIGRNIQDETIIQTISTEIMDAIVTSNHKQLEI